MASRNTSIKAYNEIMSEGLLGKRQMQVYSTLYAIGPATAAEVSEADTGSFTNPSKGDNSHARLSELTEMGSVEQVGQKKCSITGREAILWDVTSAIPKKYVKKPTKLALLEQDFESFLNALDDCFKRPISDIRKLKEIQLEIIKVKEKIL